MQRAGEAQGRQGAGKGVQHRTGPQGHGEDRQNCWSLRTSADKIKKLLATGDPTAQVTSRSPTLRPLKFIPHGLHAPHLGDVAGASSR